MAQGYFEFNPKGKTLSLVIGGKSEIVRSLQTPVLQAFLHDLNQFKGTQLVAAEICGRHGLPDPAKIAAAYNELLNIAKYRLWGSKGLNTDGRDASVPFIITGLEEFWRLERRYTGQRPVAGKDKFTFALVPQ